MGSMLPYIYIYSSTIRIRHGSWFIRFGNETADSFVWRSPEKWSEQLHAVDWVQLRFFTAREMWGSTTAVQPSNKRLF